MSKHPHSKGSPTHERPAAAGAAPVHGIRETSKSGDRTGDVWPRGTRSVQTRPLSKRTSGTGGQLAKTRTGGPSGVPEAGATPFDTAVHLCPAGQISRSTVPRLYQNPLSCFLKPNTLGLEMNSSQNLLSKGRKLCLKNIGLIYAKV